MPAVAFPDGLTPEEFLRRHMLFHVLHQQGPVLLGQRREVVGLKRAVAQSPVVSAGVGHDARFDVFFAGQAR